MRAEGGDVFSYLSYRTFQRSLKGVQFELQPRVGSGNTRHSLLLFSGANQALWNDWDWSKDNSSGASWLMENGDLGSMNLNLVYSEFDPEIFNSMKQDQWVASLAAETNFNLGSHNFNLEAEYAWFDGDHAGDFDPADGQNRDDRGIYAELIGQAYQQLSYRLRFEEYGYDFRPRGSVVFNDRRSYEGHVGWRFRDGLSLRGRVQSYEDRWDSINQLDTDIYGVDFTGDLFSIAPGAVTGRIRAFHEEVQDDFNTLDRESDVLDISANTPLNELTSIDFRLGWTSRDDSKAAGDDADTGEVDVSLNRLVSWSNFTGAISPGLTYRDVDSGPGEGEDWEPTIAVNLSDSIHSFRASYAYLDQSRDVNSAQSLSTQSLSLHYHYSFRQHEIGLDGAWYDRDPDKGNDTEASKISVYWTWYLDRPAKSTAYSSSAARLDPAASLDGPLILDQTLLVRLAPGQNLDVVMEKMSASGAPTPSRQGDVIIYELPLLQSITLRQRVALLQRDRVVDKVTLIIDFADDGTPQTAQQDFEQVREVMIRSFGSPSQTFEVGQFGLAYIVGVNSNRLIRNVEWETGQGVLRLGMPRRIDSTVRMELQHAPAFAPPRNTMWSINEVR